MGREFELKYRATPEAHTRVEGDYPGPWQTIAMETTYYDTPGGDLSRLHWTLRRRYENGCAVCTLKTPCPDGGRGEWEVNCPDILDAIPALCKLGAPRQLLACLATGVEPVCGARFTRRCLTIAYEDAELELALDRGALLGGGREEPLWEIEVELKSGPDAAALAFAQTLAETYDLQPEDRSKYRRALDLTR